MQLQNQQQLFLKAKSENRQWATNIQRLRGRGGGNNLALIFCSRVYWPQNDKAFPEPIKRLQCCCCYHVTLTALKEADGRHEPEMCCLDHPHTNVPPCSVAFTVTHAGHDMRTQELQTETKSWYRRTASSIVLPFSGQRKLIWASLGAGLRICMTMHQQLQWVIHTVISCNQILHLLDAATFTWTQLWRFKTCMWAEETLTSMTEIKLGLRRLISDGNWETFPSDISLSLKDIE